MKESTTICFLRCMQLTMVKRFEMVKLLFVILSVFKIDAIKIENSTCYGQICFPYGYDRHERPKENFTIYVNFQSAENAIKQIDVYKMMISFEPLVVLAWADHRLKIMTFRSSNSTFVSFGDTALDKIWTPRITISNHATRDQSFNNPGKIS